jgi:hypothetical protein
VATVAAIRAGLKARVETTGLRTLDYRPGSISPPTAIVARRETRYDVSFDGADDSTFVVTVFVSSDDPRAAQDNIDAYLNPAGSTSIAAAIHGDPTLGSVVDYSRVVAATDDGLVEYGGVQYQAATFLIEVGD